MDEHDQKYLRRLMGEERGAKAAADKIMETAMLDGRDMTDEEQEQVKAHHGEWTKAKDGVARAQADLKLKAMFAEPDPGTDDLGSTFGGTRTEAGPLRGKTIGEMFVSSGIWKSMAEAKTRDGLPNAFKSATVSIPQDALAVTRGLKSASSPLLESNATSLFGDGSSPGPITTVLPGVYTPGLVQLPPAIADLLPVVPIQVGNSATYRIAKERDFPQYPGDLPIDESDTKPTAQYEFDVVTVALTKLAAITKISDEWLEDDAATVAFLNADLPAQLRIVEEYYLAAKLYDSVADATPLDSASVGYDALAAAILAIQEAGFNPNAVILAPADWWKMRVEKLVAGDGDYVSGGPFAPQNNPWGLTPIISAAATADHPLVGDFTRGAYIQRKGGMRMDSTNSNDDDFENNLVTIRVEMREAVQKVYPEAFKKADISS